MIFISFADILPESISHFAKEAKYAKHSTKLALYVLKIDLFK